MLKHEGKIDQKKRLKKEANSYDKTVQQCCLNALNIPGINKLVKYILRANQLFYVIENQENKINP